MYLYLEIFRQAASLFLDDLGEETQGHGALERAVQLDISHRATFKRWYAVLRERKDFRDIVELLGRRIEVSNDAAELTALYWDRARGYRALDDLPAALDELDNLELLESDHVGAHALRGEIYIRQERYDLAATKLAQLAELDAAPREQRLMSGLAAVDLFETKLQDLPSALAVLRVLTDANLETLAVRERLAKAAANAEEPCAPANCPSQPRPRAAGGAPDGGGPSEQSARDSSRPSASPM